MKDLFFDSPAVTGAVSKERRQALSKAGAFVRSTARRSMRRGKGPSKPGRPPNRHENPLLYKRLFFAYDAPARSVVIGPEGFSGSEAPAALEHGGTAIIAPRRRRDGTTTAAQTAEIEERPYMGPAFAKELPRMAEPWAHSIGGG